MYLGTHFSEAMQIDDQYCTVAEQKPQPPGPASGGGVKRGDVAWQRHLKKGEGVDDGC